MSHVMHWRFKHGDNAAVCGATRDRGFMRSTTDHTLVSCVRCIKTKAYEDEMAQDMENALQSGLQPNQFHPDVFGKYKVPTARFSLEKDPSK